MIALDSSAIIAILKKEQEALTFAEIISEYDWIIGAPTAFECFLVARNQGTEEDVRALDLIFSYPSGSVINFGEEHFRIARLAFDSFGKGQDNSTKLNFGDCLSYAVAKVNRVPLLYKGNDFTHTDIEPAYRL